MRENDRLVGHRTQHRGVDQTADRQTDEDIGAGHRVGEAARVGVDGERVARA